MSDTASLEFIEVTSLVSSTVDVGSNASSTIDNADGVVDVLQSVTTTASTATAGLTLVGLLSGSSDVGSDTGGSVDNANNVVSVFEDLAQGVPAATSLKLLDLTSLVGGTVIIGELVKCFEGIDYEGSTYP